MHLRALLLGQQTAAESTNWAETQFFERLLNYQQQIFKLRSVSTTFQARNGARKNYWSYQKRLTVCVALVVTLTMKVPRMYLNMQVVKKFSVKKTRRQTVFGNCFSGKMKLGSWRYFLCKSEIGTFDSIREKYSVKWKIWKRVKTRKNWKT